jgi:diguanylate cyclase (GGDEF)-like protein
MIYIAPSLFAFFAITFGTISYKFDSLRHLAFFAVAFALCGTGFTMQVVWWPPNSAANSIIATSAYLLGAQCLIAGVSLRANKPLSWSAHATLFWTLTLLSMYFLFMQPNVIARTYVLNFGLGIILLFGAWKTRDARKGSSADRLLFWTLVVVGLHFFPRTLLTASTFIKDSTGYGQTTFWIVLQYFMALMAAAGATVLLIATGIDIASSIKVERDTDFLTGLLNRRGFQIRADELMRDQRTSRSVILLDLDNFKSINDRFGHKAGDDVLRHLALVLKDNCRQEDVLVRLGGEEFAIFVQGMSATAAILAEHLRQSIEAHDFGIEALDYKVTASFGVADLRQGEDIWDVVRRADIQLYQAKASGRNTVEVASFQHT